MFYILFLCFILTFLPKADSQSKLKKDFYLDIYKNFSE